MESAAWALRRALLVAAHLQHFYSATALDQENADQPRGSVFSFRRDPGWHVAGALHHRRGQFAPRLPDLVVGHVLSHALGLDDLHRNYRHVPGGHVPVPAALAGDLDL